MILFIKNESNSYQDTGIGINLQETPTENGENHMYGSKMGFLSE